MKTTYISHSNGLINTFEGQNTTAQILVFALWIEERALDRQELARRILAKKMVKKICVC